MCSFAVTLRFSSFSLFLAMTALSICVLVAPVVRGVVEKQMQTYPFSATVSTATRQLRTMVKGKGVVGKKEGDVQAAEGDDLQKSSGKDESDAVSSYQFLPNRRLDSTINFNRGNLNNDCRNCGHHRTLNNGATHESPLDYNNRGRFNVSNYLQAATSVTRSIGQIFPFTSSITESLIALNSVIDDVMTNRYRYDQTLNYGILNSVDAVTKAVLQYWSPDNVGASYGNSEYQFSNKDYSGWNANNGDFGVDRGYIQNFLSKESPNVYSGGNLPVTNYLSNYHTSNNDYLTNGIFGGKFLRNQLKLRDGAASDINSNYPIFDKYARKNTSNYSKLFK